ncbi:MAG: hypothetical protein MHPSP_003611, partial [Paramarteilia canceri]
SAKDTIKQLKEVADTLNNKKLAYKKKLQNYEKKGSNGNKGLSLSRESISQVLENSKLCPENILFSGQNNGNIINKEPIKDEKLHKPRPSKLGINRESVLATIDPNTEVKDKIKTPKKRSNKLGFDISLLKRSFNSAANDIAAELDTEPVEDKNISKDGDKYTKPDKKNSSCTTS